MTILTTTHVIQGVVPKPGKEHNPWHSEMLGKKCIILECKVNKPAWLAVETDREEGTLHRYHTSPVVGIQWDEDHRVMAVETKNTTYYIREAYPLEREERKVFFDPIDWKHDLAWFF